MNKYLESLIIFLVLFVLIGFGNYFFNLKRKYKNKDKIKKVKKKTKKNKKKHKYEFNIMELSYLINKFKLDVNKMDMLYVLKWISFLDAFIISFTSAVIIIIPLGIMWQFLIGFVMVFGLIYAIYEIFGRYLVKKGWQK